ncbi:MAG: hypothetical protein K6347_05030 [Campylobacterales bacterium]
MKLKRVGLCALLATGSAYAISPFQLDVTVTGVGSYSQGFVSVEDAINGLDQKAIEQKLSRYDGTQPAHVNFNFRGLPILVAFPNPSSSTLVLNIPSIGVSETFQGATRDESANLLEDWFKKNGGDAVDRLMAKLAETTPNDPIAGNPNSLMAQSVANDFMTGFFAQVADATTSLSATTITPDATATLSKTDTISPTTATSSNNMIGIMAQYGSFAMGGYDSKTYTLPISYTIRSDSNPRKKLTISIPLGMVDIEQAKSYKAGLGLAATFPISDAWLLTPALGYGVTASIDLGSVGHMASGSLTSSYTWRVGSHKLSMGNMIGHYRTLAFSAGDYSFDPGISNTVFRNGLMWSIPTGAIATNTSLELFVIDTQYTGTELYNMRYDEVGFAWGLDRASLHPIAGKIIRTDTKLKIGATYLVADNDSKGFTVNFGWQF